MERLTRRELLRRSGQVAAAAAFASQLEWLTGCGRSGKAPKAADWHNLAQRLQGRLVRPGEAGFAALNAPVNARYADVLPTGIAVCAGPEDVRQSILWARDYDIPCVPRAGGHSYGGFSLTRGLLVDVGRMNGVALNPADGTATIGPGARLGHVYAHLQPHDIAFSAGRCPSVGIAGLALGGGFGFSARKFGLTTDALTETQVATADGQILVCSEQQNPDLFWACRGGGGGNFGINTSFTFRTHPVKDVLLYNLTWDWKDARTVLATLQDVASEAPDDWSLLIRLGSVGRPGRTRQRVGALGQFFGPRQELLSILDPVLSVAKPTQPLIARRTFWQAKNALAETAPHGLFAVKSNFVSQPFSGEGISTILRAVERWPGSSSPEGAGITLFAWGGAIQNVKPRETAFFHRRARFLMAYGTSWGRHDARRLVSANLGWLDRLANEIGPHVSREAYQNFTDPSLEGWARAYYGDNLERLVQVKKQFDPDDFFRFKQSIPTHL